MITFPNAKVNLGLSVVRKRPDGYHDLETVFYPVAISDELEVRINDTEDIRLTIEGIDIDCDPEKNLVVKAYRLMQSRHEMPGVDVTLRKKIPFGAGMGGGSADAAFMLRMLNDIAGNPFPMDEIERMAATLGADCPFFCRNTPVYAEGTGDVFSPVVLSLRGYYMVVVKPPVGVSTKEAFSSIIPIRPAMSVKEIIENRPVEEWRSLLKNDFEDSVFPLYPEIASIKQTLYDKGAVYASMSGSGSSVFGLFDSLPELEECFHGCFLWQGNCGI